MTYTPHVSSDPLQQEQEPRAGQLYVPEAEPDRVDRESPYYAASPGLALQETFDDAQITGRLLGFIGADQERRFDDQRRRVFGADAPALLSVDQANAEFGVPGRLTFDAPVDRNIAGWRQSQAQERAFREEVTANAGLEWWQSLGAGFAGSLLDPAALPLWLAPEFAAGRVLEAGLVGGRMAALPTVARGALRGGVEGVAGGVLVEGVNLWLHHEAADDYDFGQATANVLLGGILGAGLGTVGGWWEGRGGRRGRAPAAVEALDDNARMGAFADALEAMRNDRPVDLTPVLRRAIEQGDLQAPGAGRTMGNVLDDAMGRMNGGAFDIERGQTPDGATFFVQPNETLATREGLGVGDGLFGWVEDGQLRIERADLKAEAQGKGLGLDMYARALREAREAGLDLVSDREVSPKAERVWRALQRRGVPVEEASDASRAGDAEPLTTTDGGPVFRVRAARTAGAAPVADTARDLTDRLNAWYSKPGGAAGPVAAPVKDRSRPSRAAVEPATPGKAGGKPKVAKGAQALPKGQPYADPEIAALAADTEAMLAREGLTLEGDDLSPQRIADAVSAGAFCLANAA